MIVVTATIGTRDDSGETVSAGQWAQSACGAVGVWRGEMEAIVEDDPDAERTGGTGSEEPQSETPQGRTGFVRDGARARRPGDETLVAGIDNAGVPDTPQGNEAAQLVSDWADSALQRPRGRAGLARRGGGLARGVDRRSSRARHGRSGHADERRADVRRRRRASIRSSQPRCRTRAPVSSCGRRRARR